MATADRRLQKVHSDWQTSPEAEAIAGLAVSGPFGKETVLEGKASGPSFAVIVLALLHRSFIKSYRDVVAYGIRFAMYTGLAIMMGTGMS